MKKGFIGPIGDDFPSIIALILALGLFFSAVTFTLNVYNQKLSEMDALKGSVEIARVVLDKGILTDLNPPEAKYTAQTYALNYDITLDNEEDSCDRDAYKFSYLVAVADGGDIKLHRLMLCTWK